MANNIKKFRLYSEWRNKEIFGVDLADAMTRAKTIQRPDKMERYDTGQHSGMRVAEPGEVFKIKSVLDTYPGKGTRGTDKYFVALVEFADGSINEIIVFDYGLCGAGDKNDY